MPIYGIAYSINSLRRLLPVPPSDCTPESIFSSRVEHQVDLDRKLQEDPLMAIRKKEMDTKKKLLNNPIKMKQLKGYVSLLCL